MFVSCLRLLLEDLGIHRCYADNSKFSNKDPCSLHFFCKFLFEDSCPNWVKKMHFSPCYMDIVMPTRSICYQSIPVCFYSRAGGIDVSGVSAANVTRSDKSSFGPWTTAHRTGRRAPRMTTKGSNGISPPKPNSAVATGDHGRPTAPNRTTSRKSDAVP